MVKRKLGNIDIELSEAGYGAAALFGKDVLGKQGISDEKAYELIETALKYGVTFFDTGFNYGYAEYRLGSCISEAISRGLTTREEIVIETKCGEVLNDDGSYGENNWTPDWIKRSLEISLQRLRMSYIDLYAMHGGGITDFSDSLINTFQDLKSKKVIRAFGINTFDTDVIEWVAENGVFDYVMLDYNIMKQDREELIEKLKKKGVGVIAGCSLGQALFTRNIYKVRNRNDLWYLARTLLKFRPMLNKSKDFRFLSKEKNYTGNQLALRYVLDNENISSAVFSTINKDHLIEDLGASDIVMPEEIVKKIKSVHK